MNCLRGSKVGQIEIADDFYDAYERCFCRHEKAIRAIPGFVNGLFAAELYLKLLAGNNIGTLKGKEKHNLLALYKLLSGNEKNYLESIAAPEGGQLVELLKRIGDGFIVWRYIYEDGNEDFGNKYPFEYTKTFLERYLPKLKEMAHEKIDR